VKLIIASNNKKEAKLREINTLVILFRLVIQGIFG
jgi:hypothetical protein